MSYHRSQNRKQRLNRLYNKTKHKCSTGGVYYDDNKDRLVFYQLSSRTNGYQKWLKSKLNRKLRKDNLNIYPNSLYKRKYEYWWDIF